MGSSVNFILSNNSNCCNWNYFFFLLDIKWQNWVYNRFENVFIGKCVLDNWLKINHSEWLKNCLKSLQSEFRPQNVAKISSLQMCQEIISRVLRLEARVNSGSNFEAGGCEIPPSSPTSPPPRLIKRSGNTLKRFDEKKTVFTCYF